MIDSLLSDLSIETRSYQIRIVNKTIDMFRGTHVNRAGEQERVAHSVLIESPTGSGKTVMGLLIARWVQDNWGFRIGWVAMRRNLLAQAAEENCARGFGVRFQPISMFDKRPPSVDLLVVDEAQHDAAMSMANLHEMIRPKRILGLSATPYRTDRVKLCFQRVIRDADIHHLIQDGYLSPYHHYTMPKYAPRQVAEFYLREPSRWGKTLIFFHRLVRCQECCQVLLQHGIRSEVVTAQSDRERQLDDFAAGRIQVLLSMAILAEGFDCPSLQTVFCRPSGRSCTIQMGGRVFRRYLGMPYKQIVQCSETRHPFPRTAAPAEQYVWTDGGWRALRINRHLATVSTNALRLIATSRVVLPEFIARKPENPVWRRDREED